MPSTQQQPREGAGKVPDLGPAPDFALSARDVRRKRPPALAFLLKLDNVRKVMRLATLVTLDVFGVYMAIVSALTLKAGLLSGEWNPRSVIDPVGTADASTSAFASVDHALKFAILVTVLLFARSGLYASRGERPGMTRIVSSLFQVGLVALVFAVAIGKRFDSYYIFYGSLFFGVVYVSLLRLG